MMPRRRPSPMPPAVKMRVVNSTRAVEPIARGIGLRPGTFCITLYSTSRLTVLSLSIRGGGQLRLKLRASLIEVSLRARDVLQDGMHALWTENYVSQAAEEQKFGSE